MSLWSMPSFRYGGDELDQAGRFRYDEEIRYRWIYAPRVALISRPHLTRFTGFYDFYRAHSCH